MAHRLLGRGHYLILLLSCVAALTAVAQETLVNPIDPLKAAEQHNARRRALAEEAAAIERLRQEVRFLRTEQAARLESLPAEQLTEAAVEQARLDVNAMRLLQADLQAGVVGSERRIKDLEQVIRTLEGREQLLQNPAKNETEGANRAEQLRLTQQALAQTRVDLELERQQSDILRDRLELMALRLPLAEQWQAELDKRYRLQEELNRQEAQADLLRRLERERQAHRERAEELRRRLERETNKLSGERRLWLETSIQGAEDKSNLLQLNIRLAKTDDEIKQLTALAEPAQPETKLADLRHGLDQLRSLRSLTHEAGELQRQKIALLEQQKLVIERRAVSTVADQRLRAEAVEIVTDLVEEFTEGARRVQAQMETLQQLQQRLDSYYSERVSHELLVRESLPDNVEQWRQLLEGITAAPTVLVHQLRLSAASSLKAVLEAGAWRWGMLIALELALAWCVLWARRRLNRLIAKAKAKEDTSFSGRLVRTVLQLLRKNLLGMGLAAALVLMIWMFQVPQPGLAIIITVVLLWVGIKTPINLAWLLLAAPQLPPAHHRPGLYRQVFWTLLIGGLLAAMTILAHLSGVPKTVVNAFDRVFMAYWLWAFVPALRIRRLLVDLLAGRYGGRFWFVSLRLTTLLWPLSLLGAAVLGLFGYLNLAWAVAWHLLMFLAVLVGWLMVRGLLGDLTVLLKNYAVTHSSYGLLWTQDVINPLHRILRLLLFVGAWGVLLQVYGWTRESAVSQAVQGVLGRPLFTFGGAAITLQGILITVVIILMVIWLGKWSRTITYRWLLSNIADLGIRHSLSVFSQYAIVLMGFLVTLNIIGIDLTTVTVFAGALGVVLGFGMQATANNFISGLLLLIERPLRSGDFVKIGTNEGEITRIGIRSLTVKTWDNMEVITNSFTNWTHQDKIIRTVLMVRVSYSDDPHQARAVMEQVLAEHPAVLTEPESMVLLWEFSDSCFKFRVQYFIDLGEHGLFQTRTQIMFAIWDAFRKAGIKIPYPQRDLFIKEWPAGKEGMPDGRWPPAPTG
jgi:potassium efflux system protein